MSKTHEIALLQEKQRNNNRRMKALEKRNAELEAKLARTLEDFETIADKAGRIIADNKRIPLIPLPDMALVIGIYTIARATKAPATTSEGDKS